MRIEQFRSSFRLVGLIALSAAMLSGCGGSSGSGGDGGSPANVISPDDPPSQGPSAPEETSQGLTATAWGKLTDVEVGSGDASNAVVAMDAKGNALSIWAQHNGTQFEVRAAPKPASDEDWTDLGPLSSGTRSVGQYAWSAIQNFRAANSLAMNPDGKAVAAWFEKNGSNSTVYVAHYDKGAFASPIPMVTPDCNRSESPYVVMNAKGDAVLTWMCNAGSDSTVMVAVYDSTANAWSTPLALHGEEITFDTYAAQSSQQAPTAAITDEGDAMVIWAGIDVSGNRNIYSAHYDGTQWSAPAEVDGLDKAASQPTLAATPTGFLASWVQNDGTDDSIYASHWESPNRSWNTPTQIESHTANGIGPALCTNKSGEAFVAWSRREGNESFYFMDLYGARYVPDTGWEEEKLIYDLGGASPSVICDDQGNALVVFVAVHVQSALFTPDSGWTRPSHVTPYNNGSELAVAGNGKGKVVATWKSNDVDGTDNIHAASRD